MQRYGLFLAVPSLMLCASAPAPQPVWKGLGATHLGQPSADGRFVSGIHPDSGELLIHDLASGLQRRIGHKKQPYEFAYFSTISPDSKWIAYAWYNEERFYELRVASLETGEERTVFRNEESGFVQPCAFSPDSKQILTLLFRKDNISQIALIPAAPSDGAAPRILKSLNWLYPKRMDWSPDGKSIVYDAFARDGVAQRDVFLLSAEGARETRLIESPGDDVFPVFSRDGKRVYFSTDRSGEPEIWAFDLESRAAAPIRKGLGRALILGVTNDEKLFYATRTGGSTIFSARFDPGSARIVSRPEPIGEGVSAAWSPDGKQIAWLARQSAENYGTESRFIAVRDAVPNGQTRTLAPKLAHIESLSWNGAGKLLLSGSDAKGRGGVFETTLDGNAAPVRAEAGAPHSGFPARAPFYATGRELFRIGKDEEPIARFPARISALAAAPDGETVAVATGTTLTVIGPKGRFESRQPSQPVTALEWSTGGKNLMFVQKDELWWTGWALLQMTRVARMAAPVDSISLHPAGEELLFSAGRARSEVWAVEVGAR